MWGGRRATGPRDEAVAPPRLGGWTRSPREAAGLGTRRRTEAQGGGCLGDAESVLRALSTLDFACLGRSALLARTLFGR